MWLHVANGGAVISAGDVDRLFEPFRRGGRVRTATRGAGLGLAIVRLIVEAHHGRLQAAARRSAGWRCASSCRASTPTPWPVRWDAPAIGGQRSQPNADASERSLP